VVSLRQVAAERPQTVQLLLGLDPLGHDLEPQAVGQRDGAGDDRRVAVVVSEAGDERAVDLEHVQGKIVQIAERRITGAEIVNRD